MLQSPGEYRRPYASLSHYKSKTPPVGGGGCSSVSLLSAAPQAAEATPGAATFCRHTAKAINRLISPCGGKKSSSLWLGHPPATDVILHLNVPCAGPTPARLEIDKLPDGIYRATVGTLFQHQEITRTRDLEALIRQANVMAGYRSFDDVVRAFRAMRTLG